MRRTKVTFLAFAAATVALWAAATPAGAHAAFTGSSTTANSDQTLVMSVPHERAADAYNVDIKIQIPQGWVYRGCTTKPSWTCANEPQAGHDVVHFVGGSLAVEDETFKFSVHTPADLSTYSFPTLQTYNTGETVAWIDPTGSTPAPKIKTVAEGTVTPPPTQPSDHSNPTTAPDPTVTTPAPTTPGATPTTPSGPAPTVTLPNGDPAPTTETTDTTDTTVAGEAPGGTELPTGVPGTVISRAKSATPAGGAAAETAAGPTSSSGSGAAPVIAILVVLALLGVGGALFIRSRQPSPAAGPTTDGETPDP